MRRRGRPGRREGLHPAATALVVAGLAAVAVGVGWFAGAAGPGAPPMAPPTDRPPTVGPGPPPPGEDAAGPDPELADAGAVVFETRCAPCHTIGRGPSGGPVEGGDLARAALRRDPAWVRAMVERPDSMFRADSVARELLELHDLTVADVTSNDGDLAALLAYLRAFDPGR